MAYNPPANRSPAGRLAPCGCDVERLTVRPAESAGCDILHWHLHDAINRSVRRDPHNAPSEEPAIPEVTFRIDGRAIGQTPREALKKRTLIRDRAGGRVIVIHPDDVGERVAEIETSLVGTPGECVGDSKIAPPYGYFAIRVEAK